MTEPNEEPAEIESLEWLYALEHDGEETMADLTDAPVRLLLNSGSGGQLVLLILPLIFIRSLKVQCVRAKQQVK